MRRGLSFRRRRKQVNFAILQEAVLWIGGVVLSFVLACILVYFFGRTISNVGQSMEPTIYSGDRVLINQFVYMMKDPDYGDVVVFKPNGNVNSHYHMKRVVGKPGDTVQIISGRVFVNGEALEEEITTEPMEEAGVAETEVKLGKDEYFVLGDNRNASEDSRSANIGNVNRKDILGKAWFIISPREQFGYIH
ncbi:MAG: signal peptidase I [Lachnospiraceae bacterium]|nr:signal peptidase I [Lachnospiraceae bacterium]